MTLMLADWSERLRPHRGVATMLLFALLLRLAVAPYGGYEYDLDTFRSWAVQLTSEPPWQFYEMEPSPDHLPGDLWVLWGTGRVYGLFSNDPGLGGDGFVWLLKLAATLGDLAAGFALYLTAAALRGRTAGMVAAGAYLFNPASIFLGAVWGQLDAIPLAAAIGAAGLFVSGRARLPFPLLTYAALIKPQFAALIPLLVLARMWQPRADESSGPFAEGRARAATDVLVGGALSCALAAAIMLPYGVGWPPLGEWSALDRVRVAVDRWPFATMYALNVWAAIDPPVRGLTPDSSAWLFGLSYRSWGVALTVATYAFVLGVYAWKRDRPTFLWALVAIMFLLFLFPTRVHERYVLPTVGLLALLLSYGPAYRLLFAGVSLACLVNLYFAYALVDPPPLVVALRDSRLFYTYVSLLNVAMFLVLAIVAVNAPRAMRAGTRPGVNLPGLPHARRIARDSEPPSPAG